MAPVAPHASARAALVSDPMHGVAQVLALSRLIEISSPVHPLLAVDFDLLDLNSIQVH